MQVLVKTRSCVKEGEVGVGPLAGGRPEATHSPVVFQRLLQNHLLLSTHRTTQAGSWIPGSSREGRSASGDG